MRRELELAQLQNAQDRDAYLDGEAEYIGRRESANRVGMLLAADALYSEPGFAKIEDEMSDEPRVLTHNEEQQSIVRAVVATLNDFEREVYYHVFGQGLSVRQTAAELKAPSHMRVQRAVDVIKLRVLAALQTEEDIIEGQSE